eukprot:Gb_35554 [translate_table: standard]
MIGHITKGGGVHVTVANMKGGSVWFEGRTAATANAASSFRGLERARRRKLWGDSTSMTFGRDSLAMVTEDNRQLSQRVNPLQRHAQQTVVVRGETVMAVDEEQPGVHRVNPALSRLKGDSGLVLDADAEADGSNRGTKGNIGSTKHEAWLRYSEKSQTTCLDIFLLQSSFHTVNKRQEKRNKFKKTSLHSHLITARPIAEETA